MKSKSNAAGTLESVLSAIAPSKDDSALPPVHLWNPDHCGDIQMEIRSDGSWWHEGSRIGRERLVKLFSRILRKDPDGEIYLVTPYEKVIVHVEDAPFLAVRVDQIGEGADQVLKFTTNLDDIAVAGPSCPLRVETDTETLEPSPYVLVRGGLEAKLTRACFYDLVSMAMPNAADPSVLGVWSSGKFFEIGPSGE